MAKKAILFEKISKWGNNFYYYHFLYTFSKILTNFCQNSFMPIQKHESYLIFWMLQLKTFWPTFSNPVNSEFSRDFSGEKSTTWSIFNGNDLVYLAVANSFSSGPTGPKETVGAMPPPQPFRFWQNHKPVSSKDILLLGPPP